MKHTENMKIIVLLQVFSFVHCYPENVICDNPQDPDPNRDLVLCVWGEGYRDCSRSAVTEILIFANRSANTS